MTSRAHEQTPMFVVSAAHAPVVDMSDWTMMFDAVRARLRLTAAAQPTVTNDEHALGSSGRLRSEVLECVTALDQLHDLLSQALEPRAGAERELRPLHVDLIAPRPCDPFRPDRASG